MPDSTATPADPAKAREADDVREDAYEAEPADDVYDPSTVEVNRARQQGLGVGQKDLDYQRDPNDERPKSH